MTQNNSKTIAMEEKNSTRYTGGVGVDGVRETINVLISSFSWGGVNHYSSVSETGICGNINLNFLHQKSITVLILVKNE